MEQRNRFRLFGKWIRTRILRHPAERLARQRQYLHHIQVFIAQTRLTNNKCCNPKLNGGGGWGIFNGILGWQNSATYGSVLSYDLYWLAVIIGFLAMRYNETKGHWPLMKAKKEKGETKEHTIQSSGSSIADTDKEAEEGKAMPQVHSVERGHSHASS